MMEEINKLLGFNTGIKDIQMTKDCFSDKISLYAEINPIIMDIDGNVESHKIKDFLIETLEARLQYLKKQK